MTKIGEWNTTAVIYKCEVCGEPMTSGVSVKIDKGFKQMCWDCYRKYIQKINAKSQSKRKSEPKSS